MWQILHQSVTNVVPLCDLCEEINIYHNRSVLNNAQNVEDSKKKVQNDNLMLNGV